MRFAFPILLATETRSISAGVCCGELAVRPVSVGYLDRAGRLSSAQSALNLQYLKDG